MLFRWRGRRPRAPFSVNPCVLLGALALSALVCGGAAAGPPHAASDAPGDTLFKPTAPIYAAVYGNAECELGDQGDTATLVALSDTGGDCGTTSPSTDALSEPVWYRASRAGVGKWNVSLHCDAACTQCSVSHLVVSEGQCVTRGLAKSVQLVTCAGCVGVGPVVQPRPSRGVANTAKGVAATAATAATGAASSAHHIVTTVPGVEAGVVAESGPANHGAMGSATQQSGVPIRALVFNNSTACWRGGARAAVIVHIGQPGACAHSHVLGWTGVQHNTTTGLLTFVAGCSSSTCDGGCTQRAAGLRTAGRQNCVAFSGSTTRASVVLDTPDTAKPCSPSAIPDTQTSVPKVALVCFGAVAFFVICGGCCCAHHKDQRRQPYLRRSACGDIQAEMCNGLGTAFQAAATRAAAAAAATRIAGKVRQLGSWVKLTRPYDSGLGNVRWAMLLQFVVFIFSAVVLSMWHTDSPLVDLANDVAKRQRNGQMLAMDDLEHASHVLGAIGYYKTWAQLGVELLMAFLPSVVDIKPRQYYLACAVTTTFLLVVVDCLFWQLPPFLLPPASTPKDWEDMVEYQSYVGLILGWQGTGLLSLFMMVFVAVPLGAIVLGAAMHTGSWVGHGSTVRVVCLATRLSRMLAPMVLVLPTSVVHEALGEHSDWWAMLIAYVVLAIVLPAFGDWAVWHMFNQLTSSDSTARDHDNGRTLKCRMWGIALVLLLFVLVSPVAAVLLCLHVSVNRRYSMLVAARCFLAVVVALVAWVCASQCDEEEADGGVDGVGADSGADDDPTNYWALRGDSPTPERARSTSLPARQRASSGASGGFVAPRQRGWSAAGGVLVGEPVQFAVAHTAHTLHVQDRLGMLAETVAETMEDGEPDNGGENDGADDTTGAAATRGCVGLVRAGLSWLLGGPSERLPTMWRGRNLLLVVSVACLLWSGVASLTRPPVAFDKLPHINGTTAVVDAAVHEFHSSEMVEIGCRLGVAGMAFVAILCLVLPRRLRSLLRCRWCRCSRAQREQEQEQEQEHHQQQQQLKQQQQRLAWSQSLTVTTTALLGIGALYIAVPQYASDAGVDGLWPNLPPSLRQQLQQQVRAVLSAFATMWFTRTVLPVLAVAPDALVWHAATLLGSAADSANPIPSVATRQWTVAFLSWLAPAVRGYVISQMLLFSGEAVGTKVLACLVFLPPAVALLVHLCLPRTTSTAKRLVWAYRAYVLVDVGLMVWFGDLAGCGSDGHLALLCGVVDNAHGRVEFAGTACAVCVAAGDLMHRAAEAFDMTGTHARQQQRSAERLEDARGRRYVERIRRAEEAKRRRGSTSTTASAASSACAWTGTHSSRGSGRSAGSAGHRLSSGTHTTHNSGRSAASACGASSAWQRPRDSGRSTVDNGVDGHVPGRSRHSASGSSSSAGSELAVDCSSC